MPEQIDVGTLLTRASISIDPEESPDERVGRLGRENAHHRFEIVKGYILFFGVVLGIAVVGGLCAYEAIIDASASAETKRWAQTTLSALFTGSITFILGQKTAK